MKKLLMAILILGSCAPLIAEMRYNPVNNLMYSYPESSDVNQAEYMKLLFDCYQIGENMIRMNNRPLSNNDILDQMFSYLKQIGSATALRLIADLKKNTVHYADGSFMRKICS